MTNDEILKAAKDAGLFTRGNGYYAVCHQTEIERFAAIIEKRTIERCAAVCDVECNGETRMQAIHACRVGKFH